MRLIIFTAWFFVAIGLAGLLHGEENCPPAIKGQYRNGEYGYAVTIPKGLNGVWNSPCTLDPKHGCICMGAHGLTVELEPGAYLDLFAGFVVDPDHPSLADILRSVFKNLGPQPPDDISVTIRFLRRTLLAGTPAYHFVTDYEVKDQQYAEEWIVSLNNRRNVEYSVNLKAPAKRFAALRPRFRELVHTWRWIPEDRTSDNSKKAVEKKHEK